jgi:hypothetical protein
MLVLNLGAEVPPDVADVNVSAWLITFLVYLLIAVVLGGISAWMSSSKNDKRKGLAWIPVVLSLLTYTGAVAILNANFLPGFLERFGITAAAGLANQAAGQGISTGVNVAAIVAAAVLATFAIWKAGKVGIILGFLFGIAVLVATAGNNLPFLTGILSWWYHVIAGWLPGA